MNSFAQEAPVPVAIIGMGCLFPRSEGLKQYWASILDRVDAITEVPETHWQSGDYHDPDPKARDRTYCRRGGFLSPVDFPPLEFGIAPNSMEATDTTQLLGLLVARDALADAGYGASRDFNRERVSVILGISGTLELVIPLGARLGEPVWRRALADSGISGEKADAVVEKIASSYVGWQENSFPGLLGNVAAGRIANRLDLRGTNCVVDAACASSLAALELAMLELAVGRCDLAVTGGIDTFNDIFVYMCFSKTPALSPSGDVRPFDAKADGTILGEGVGMLVLKRLADARRDGDRIYAVIRGIGTSSDGKGQAVYAPSAAGQVMALQRAYTQAGIAPRTVELVEAHGTGTRVGDATELQALEEVFGAAADGGPWCALGSVKSQIGHTKAAAGSAGLIKAALALHHKVLPPTTKVEKPVEPLSNGHSPFYLNSDARPWFSAGGAPRRAAVSAFGFGGSNFHCVLEEAGPDKGEIDWDGEIQILALSGDEPGQLLHQLGAFDGLTDWAEIRGAAMRSRQAFRFESNHRLLIVVRRDETGLSALLADARARLTARGADSNHRAGRNGHPGTPRGKESIFAGTGKPPGGLAFLFPGQGSQYVGMLRDLACRFPRMQQAIGLANALCNPGETPISSRIYPRAVFNETERRAQEHELRETRVAQPAIGAVSLGLLAILEDFGLRPQLAGGHSFGELVALRAAGRLGDTSLSLMAAKRGELLSKASENEERGAMLAVFAGVDEVSEVLRANALDLVIANKNAPRQCVLSGPAAEIERSRGLFAAQEIATHPLEVSRAFHSRLVARAADLLQSALDSIDFASSPIPVFANTTAQPYPIEPGSTRALLAGQLARPVEFVAQIEAMYQLGARTFLEIGPDAKLTSLVRSILDGRDHHAIAVDSSRGASSNIDDLARSLASLAALGYAVDLTGWDGAYQPAPSKRPGLTVKVCGANARPPARAVAPSLSSETPRSFQEVAPPVEQVIPLATPVHSPPPPPMSAPPVEVVTALEHARQSLVALEKLAEQTADLHRQFLEGQAKTQQTFLKLLEHEQRLSRSLLGVPAESVAVPASGDARATRREPGPPAMPSAHPEARTARPETASARREVASPRWVAEPPPPAATNGFASNHVIAFQSPAVEAAAPERLLPEPAAPPPVPRASGSIAAVVIDIVSEKTGYPQDVLELDMQLDADLGIDSIKRVEILSALQERVPSLPSIAPEALGKLRTLRSIVEAISDPSLPSSEPARAANVPQDTPDLSPPGEIARVLIETVASKTGYPAEMLELNMKLDADLGIDSIKRVEIFSALQDRLPGIRAAGPEEIGTLGTLQDIVVFLERPAHSTAPAPSAPPPQAHSQPLPTAVNSIDKILLESVADKTGFPIDMLELDMQLDIDLGIDSIKRVEILSAVQERLPAARTVGPEQLGTLRTLRQIAEFLSAEPVPTHVKAGERPHSNGTTASSPAGGARVIDAHRNGSSARNGAGMHGGHTPAGGLERADSLSLQTLYPVSRPLDLPDGRASISLRDGGTVWIFGDRSPLAAALERRLSEHGCTTKILAPGEAHSPSPGERLSGLIVLAPSNLSDHGFITNAFRLLRAAGPALEESAARGGASLLMVSRLDGSFGLSGLAAGASPVSGSLAGLAKTAAREWPAVNCKAMDVDAAFDVPEGAARIIAEEFFKRGPLEVGLSRQGRTTVALENRANGDGPQRQAKPLAPGDLVVITGGGRGVTAHVAAALASAFQPRLVLLGRSPAPSREEEWTAGILDEAELKRALAARSGRRLTPHELGQESRRILAEREIRANLERIKAAGSQVAYESVDVRDAGAVQSLMARLQRELGPVRGLVHGAGVLADRRIVDQTDAQFDLVYQTKVLGLHNVVDVLDPQALKLMVLFSSSTARFGRVGQVAYAAANEYLNKWAQQQSLRLPGCRVLSFNWGPWAGGMVTDALKPIFEQEGIELIPLEAGAKLVVEEARREPSLGVELVVAAEREAEREADQKPLRSSPAATKAADDRESLDSVFRRDVDLESLPVLTSHVIDTHPVLPVVLILEWMAEAALSRNPGLSILGVDDFRLFKGVILAHHKPATVELKAGKPVRQDGRFHVPVELSGTLNTGKSVAHARAVIVLGQRFESSNLRLSEPSHSRHAMARAEIYQNVLFHGPQMQGIESVEGWGDRGIVGWVASAPGTSEWIDRPSRSKWLIDPLAIDSAFQLVGLWTRAKIGSNSLPTGIKGLRLFQREFPEGGVRVIVEIGSSSGARALANIELIDRSHRLLARLDGFECVIDSSLNQAFRRNRLSSQFSVVSR